MTARIDACVEEGARAWFDRTQAQRSDPGAFDMDGNRWTWDTLTEDDKTAYRALAGVIVVPALAEWERTTS